MGTVAAFLDSEFSTREPGGPPPFPPMPLGVAVDMGHAPDGTPLLDPRVFDTPEFRRNPYPYYRIMRDHYPVFHDKLHNCYYVTRYDDITACYFDDEGFNTIPKGSSSGVLGNTQLELSGVEHRRAPRFPVSFPLRYRTTGVVEWSHTTTRNISRVGVNFVANEELDPGVTVDMAFVFPTEVMDGPQAEVVCYGRVVRSAVPGTEGHGEVAVTIDAYDFRRRIPLEEG